MGAVTVKVDASGRVVIPREMREALGIPEGGELRLSIEGGELRATTRLATLRRIQEELRDLVPPDVLLSEELIADRRAEAARDVAEKGEAAKRPAPRRSGG
jgi:AbrB family looped-hinge helix DNA binding protein